MVLPIGGSIGCWFRTFFFCGGFVLSFRLCPLGVGFNPSFWRWFRLLFPLISPSVGFGRYPTQKYTFKQDISTRNHRKPNFGKDSSRYKIYTGSKFYGTPFWTWPFLGHFTTRNGLIKSENDASESEESEEESEEEE